MSKNKEDNILENEMGDLIVCDCNVSEIIRKNNIKHEKELSQAKRQRNEETASKQFYKDVFGITLLIIFIIGFLVGFKILNDQSNENIQNCLDVGYSEQVCFKMEGIY